MRGVAVLPRGSRRCVPRPLLLSQFETCGGLSQSESVEVCGVARTIDCNRLCNQVNCVSAWRVTGEPREYMGAACFAIDVLNSDYYSTVVKNCSLAAGLYFLRLSDV